MAPRVVVAAAFLVLSVVGAVTASTQFGKGDTNVLAKFAGDWETQTQIRHTGTSPREINTRGKATCVPTLGGRFFEFRTETVPPGESDLQIMTYDEEAGVYRQWVFSSDGYRHAAEGIWNPATSTLVWKGKTDVGSFVIEDHWISADRLEWTLRRTATDGKVVQTIEGIVVRATAGR